MIHQETLTEAFHALVESGRQATKQEEVYAAICAIPHSTANEVFEYLNRVRGLNLRYDSNTRARFTELRQMGRVRNTGKRHCSITGVNCLIWAPTHMKSQVA